MPERQPPLIKRLIGWADHGDSKPLKSVPIKSPCAFRDEVWDEGTEQQSAPAVAPVVRRRPWSARVITFDDDLVAVERPDGSIHIGRAAHAGGGNRDV
jgi:hypothetical protein